MLSALLGLKAHYNLEMAMLANINYICSHSYDYQFLKVMEIIIQG